MILPESPLTPLVEELSWMSLVDDLDALGKKLFWRLLRDLLFALLMTPFVTLLILVLYFDLWLIVTGTYLAF